MKSPGNPWSNSTEFNSDYDRVISRCTKKAETYARPDGFHEVEFEFLKEEDESSWRFKVRARNGVISRDSERIPVKAPLTGYASDATVELGCDNRGFGEQIENVWVGSSDRVFANRSETRGRAAAWRPAFVRGHAHRTDRQPRDGLHRNRLRILGRVAGSAEGALGCGHRPVAVARLVAVLGWRSAQVGGGSTSPFWDLVWFRNEWVVRMK